MNNLVKLKYLFNLNQKKLIKRYDEKVFTNEEYEVSNIECILERLNSYIEEIFSLKDPDTGIRLAVCYSNSEPKKIDPNNSKKRILANNLALLVFPLNDEIKYIIKKGDFFVNQEKDPVIIYGSGFNFKVFLRESCILFSKNPFENMKYYLDNGCLSLFEDLVKAEKLWNKANNKALRKTYWFGTDLEIKDFLKEKNYNFD